MIEQTTVNHMGVGTDFVEVMGLQIIEGRGPADEVPSAAAASRRARRAADP